MRALETSSRAKNSAPGTDVDLRGAPENHGRDGGEPEQHDGPGRGAGQDLAGRPPPGGPPGQDELEGAGVLLAPSSRVETRMPQTAPRTPTAPRLRQVVKPATLSTPFARPRRASISGLVVKMAATLARATAVLQVAAYPRAEETTKAENTRLHKTPDRAAARAVSRAATARVPRTPAPSSAAGRRTATVVRPAVGQEQLLQRGLPAQELADPARGKRPDERLHAAVDLAPEHLAVDPTAPTPGTPYRSGGRRRS